MASQSMQLKREIGIFQAISIVIGIIVGSGIFVSPVGVLVHAKSVGLSFIMWLITGLFSLVGAIVYAELGVTIPRSGGEYVYILATFGRLPAFIVLWISFVVIGAASTAANAIIFAEYILKPFFTSCTVPILPQTLLAALALAFLSAVNCYSVKWVTKTAIIFTISKVLAIVLIVVVGVVYLARGQTESFENAWEDSSEATLGTIAMSFYQGFWAYGGWNYLNFLTEEMKNPARNMPIAIGVSLTLITVIYILANVAYLAVLSPLEMIESNAVAVTFADNTLGVMSWIMPVFVGLSVFGSMNSEILSLSRLTFVGAAEGHMPTILSMMSYHYMTPLPAVIIMFVLTCAFLMFSEIRYLIELSGFAFCVIAAMAVSSLLYLRYKRPDIPRTIKLPLAIPITFLIVDLFIMGLTVYQSPKDCLISAALMVCSIPVYWFGVLWNPKPKVIQDMMEGLTKFLQKLLLVVPQKEKEDLPEEGELVRTDSQAVILNN